MTMTLIRTVSISGVETIISSIPATFTDLLIVASVRDDGSGTNHYLYIKFNGSSASYSGRSLVGTGASSFSTNDTSSTELDIERIGTGGGATANTFSNIQIYVPNYASTSTQKSISVDGVSETNSTSAWQAITAGLWANTGVISSFTIGNYDGSFVSGSTVSVYGILKGSGGATVS